ncbi:hypothetical protein BaRGS_00006287 [Batillaria attramentaria]|uniref:Uncharacterized protein n=1 Tax=Batillaria attramentaria TaxID=370345 RepID=A0ABD0LS11_9CAEN
MAHGTFTSWFIWLHWFLLAACHPTSLFLIGITGSDFYWSMMHYFHDTQGNWQNGRLSPVSLLTKGKAHETSNPALVTAAVFGKRQQLEMMNPGFVFHTKLQPSFQSLLQ